MNIQEASKAYLRTLYTYGKDFEQIQAFFGAKKAVTGITLPLAGKFYRLKIL